MSSYDSNNPNAIEVDGICFETLIPEEMVRLPKYGEETPVQFGVRITNQTSTPYRFDLQLFLPEILDPQGKTLQIDGGQNAKREVKESDIPLLMPGESLDFLMDAKLNWYKEHFLRFVGWYKEHFLRFVGNATYGGVWIFWLSKPGEYKVRFIYLNQLAKKKMFTLKEGRTEIDGFWIGEIKSPFASLRFR